ncbi:MAG: Gfo/Idh/MocA family protein, partial [Flavisolibacter sp.]
MNKNAKTRRSFIADTAKAAIGASFIPTIITARDKARSAESLQRPKESFSANDQIQVALIGSGGMGVADATTAISVPGIKLIAVCDLYDGRLAEAKKRWGNDIATTRDFNEIISRKDIDAVIIGTPDHWHKDISVAAMNQGK